MAEAVEPITVRVNLKERGYDIEIGPGALERAAAFLADRADVSHAVVITDANVDSLYGDPLADRLVDAGVEAHVLIVEPGEPSKSPEVAGDLWQTMLNEGCDRQTVVIAVGGGVVGDLAGFVAATYARGLRFFQVPTTLLAQVDSSVGGKTGVNLEGGKNLVGAFWQPHGVLIDTGVLTTLPDREYRAGLAEVVKYGVILDADFFERLERDADAINARDAAVLTEVIQRSCRLKADIVEADEREVSGDRAKLNYGHTFAHAIEAATGYTRLLHGEAVAMGMIAASRLAERLGRIGSDVTERQCRLLKKLGLEIETPADLDRAELAELMWRDKKVQDGQLRFILPERLGAVGFVSDPPESDVIKAMGAAAR